MKPFSADGGFSDKKQKEYKIIGLLCGLKVPFIYCLARGSPRLRGFFHTFCRLKRSARSACAFLWPPNLFCPFRPSRDSLPFRRETKGGAAFRSRLVFVVAQERANSRRFCKIRKNRRISGRCPFVLPMSGKITGPRRTQGQFWTVYPPRP